MSKLTKKRIAVTADLVGRTLHNLDELGVDYVVLIDGIPQMFTNGLTVNHAAAIVEQQYLLNAKIAELKIEAAAEKATAIPGDGDATARA